MIDREKQRYDDILYLPHHVSSKYPPMPLQDRAAQFSPFAALTGHDAAIKETARLTEKRVELDENSKEALDIRLQLLKDHLTEQPVIAFTYFKPDKKKSGGLYVTVTGIIKKIDEYERKILLQDGTEILMKELLSIEGSLFNGIYI